jgi:hypothetical protein
MNHQKGSAAVELAFVVLMLVTLSAFVVEFGRLYWTQIVLQKMAREGARAMSLASPAQFGQLLPGITVQMGSDAADSGIGNLQNGTVSLQCLDAGLQPFATTPDYCIPGSPSPADSTLGYVRVAILYPLPNLGSWMPFFFPSGGSAGYSVINSDSGYRIALNAQATFRYGGF